MRPNEKEIEEAWIEVLAHIYRAVDWKKVARNRSSYDVFEHRLSFSRHEPSVPQVIQKLCNTLGLQAPHIPLDRVDFLRQNEKEALKVLRRMTKLLTLYAAERSKQLRSEKKEKKDVAEVV